MNPQELQHEREALEETERILGSRRLYRLTVPERKQVVALLQSGASEVELFRKYEAIMFNDRMEVA